MVQVVVQHVKLFSVLKTCADRRGKSLQVATLHEQLGGHNSSMLSSALQAALQEMLIRQQNPHLVLWE